MINQITMPMVLRILEYLENKTAADYERTVEECSCRMMDLETKRKRHGETIFPGKKYCRLAKNVFFEKKSTVSATKIWQRDLQCTLDVCLRSWMQMIPEGRNMMIQYMSITSDGVDVAEYYKNCGTYISEIAKRSRLPGEQCTCYCGMCAGIVKPGNL